MELKVTYNNEQFLNDLKERINLKIIAFNENIYSEKKKAIMLKSSWGTRQSPFVLLLEDSKPIKAFYSDNNECTVHNIISYLNERSKDS